MTDVVLPADLFGHDAAQQPKCIWQRIGLVTNI